MSRAVTAGSAFTSVLTGASFWPSSPAATAGGALDGQLLKRNSSCPDQIFPQVVRPRGTGFYQAGKQS
jgi:hypothetical protein